MSGLPTLVGCAAITVACLIFCRSYADYIKERAADYRSVLGFFELMHREVSTRLAAPCELALLSKDARLADVGFFELLLQGESPGRAFSLISNKLLLAEGDLDRVQGYFDALGCGSLEGELRVLDAAITEISARESAVREEISARVGLVRTLSVLFALGISILLL